MSTIIQLPSGERAWVNGGEWKATTPETADLLQATIPIMFEGYEPDRDLAYAKIAIGLLGGEIVENYPAEDDADVPEGAIF